MYTATSLVLSVAVFDVANQRLRYGDVVELADTQDLKSCGLIPCGFKSRHPHQIKQGDIEMKNYQHLSTDTLVHKRKRLLSDIEEWERTLRETKSVLIGFYLTHCIKKAKEEIHAIDTELCYREHN